MGGGGSPPHPANQGRRGPVTCGRCRPIGEGGASRARIQTVGGRGACGCRFPWRRRGPAASMEPRLVGPGPYRATRLVSAPPPPPRPRAGVPRLRLCPFRSLTYSGWGLRARRRLSWVPAGCLEAAWPPRPAPLSGPLRPDGRVPPSRAVPGPVPGGAAPNAVRMLVLPTLSVCGAAGAER